MRELIVDNFAGGGGASEGIKRALGREPDIAINHDADALAMHEVNHAATLHIQNNIWRVDPSDVVRGRRVGLAWFSPDCKHFSKAKGGKPVKREIRDLAWVAVLWAKRVRPRVIILENVEEFQDWGPLVDNFPCPERKGQTFNKFVRELQKLGYRVEWREERACNFGAPTLRKRLFMIARCDRERIVWPNPTHAKNGEGGLRRWRTAAECIDWSLPCPSIFLTREEARAAGCKRPLAEATMARIARGVKRYVIDSANPFIVPITHQGDERVHGIDEPLRTVTTAQRGEHALVAPYLVPRYGERPGQEPRTHSVEEPIGTIVPTANQGALVVPHLMTMRNAQKPFNGADEPTHTITAEGAHLHLVSAFLAQHTAGSHPGRPARDAREPISTVTAKGSQQGIVAAHIMSLKGSDRRDADAREPSPTITAGGYHVAEVRAFLIKYYGEGGQFADPREPMHTVVTKDRVGVVTVHGQDYQIVDIGMRMLTPRELFRAQGFGDDYIIDRRPDGTALTKTTQIRLCGNSVCPDLAEALVRANCPDLIEERAAA